MDMEEVMIACLKEIVEDLGPVEGLLVWEEWVQNIMILGEVVVLLPSDTTIEKI